MMHPKTTRLLNPLTESPDTRAANQTRHFHNDSRPGRSVLHLDLDIVLPNTREVHDAAGVHFNIILSKHIRILTPYKPNMSSL